MITETKRIMENLDEKDLNIVLNAAILSLSYVEDLEKLGISYEYAKELKQKLQLNN